MPHALMLVAHIFHFHSHISHFQTRSFPFPIHSIWLHEQLPCQVQLGAWQIMNVSFGTFQYSSALCVKQMPSRAASCAFMMRRGACHLRRSTGCPSSAHSHCQMQGQVSLVLHELSFWAHLLYAEEPTFSDMVHSDSVIEFVSLF